MALVAGLGLMAGEVALASVNLPLHHWSYEAIERLTALGIIDRAMVVPKPYSRKQAAKYVARAIERIRSDQVPADGREVLAEPLIERLMQFLQPELVELGVMRLRVTSNERRVKIPEGRDERDTQETRHATDATTQQTGETIRAGARLQVEGDAFSVGHGSVR